MKADSFESDYLPEPPTPTSSALPKGDSIILQILVMCSQAIEKRTKSIEAICSL